LVGYRDEGPDVRWRYAGRVGTGFDDATLRALYARLLPCEVKKPTVVDPPTGAEAKGCHWVEPRLVCEVRYTEWTPYGRLRHPVFLGLREDKDPLEVRREGPAGAGDPADPERADADEEGAADVGEVVREGVGAASAGAGLAGAGLAGAARVSGRAAGGRDGGPGAVGSAPAPKEPAGAVAERPKKRRASRTPTTPVAGVPLTNPDRVFWPAGGGGAPVTKRELALWLDAVADRMLPEIRRRPLTLVRCPDGQDAGCFYQRHHTEGLPDATRGVVVEGHGEGQAYLWIDDREGLVGLAQVGALEIHPWGARIDDLDRPDRLIFDLDPGPGVPWEHVVDAALRVRDRLETIGLRSFAKLTGGKGIHVVVPLRPYATWDAAKPFCRAIAESMAYADPERFTAKMAKDRRENRIYLDYLRNTQTSTAVAAWSPRARAGGPVAVPVTWDALPGYPGGDPFRLPDVLASVPPDPWGPLDAVDQRLDAGVIRRMSVR
ncbi:MAG: non-homologous end-joining DNA ligase, partial [Myxococcota bacterium]